VNTADLLILGTGSLAADIVHALSHVSAASLRVVILGRDAEKTFRLALIANARAAMFRTRITFQPVHLAQFEASPLSRLFRSLKPKLIFHTASLQSPWESAAGPNRWTQLISSAGFGITLPLQLALAAEVCRAANDTRAAVINACYPDAVNAVLDHLRLPITCGIGNAAIIEAFCRAHPKNKGADVRVVAHHGHLSPWLQGNDSAVQPRVWVKTREIRPLPLRPKVGRFGDTLNHVTSSTALPVILSLLSGATLTLSIPGVPGLPGGYPFILKNRKFALRLPSSITSAQAIAHNKSGEHADGLDLTSSVKFLDRASQALASVDFPYAQGFDFSDWPAARDAMLALRERLRRFLPL